MDNNRIILLADEFEPLKNRSCGGVETIEAAIDIGNDTVCLKIGVEDKPTRLSDMVSLARAISDKLCSAILDHAARSGQTVQCHKGCSHCCSYLVPLSIPEVFRLWEELPAMGADFASGALSRFCICEAKIRDAYVSGKRTIDNIFEMPEISNWYAGLHLSCPFLSQGLCSVYERRPLACREHMVRSCPVLCKSSTMHYPEIVNMPVSILEVLGQLAAEFEQSEGVEAVILPLAFTGIEDGMERCRRTWPAIRLVKRFVEIVVKEAAKHKEPSKISV